MPPSTRDCDALSLLPLLLDQGPGQVAELGAFPFLLHHHLEEESSWPETVATAWPVSALRKRETQQEGHGAFPNAEGQ